MVKRMNPRHEFHILYLLVKSTLNWGSNSTLCALRSEGKTNYDTAKQVNRRQLLLKNSFPRKLESKLLTRARVYVTFLLIPAIPMTRLKFRNSPKDCNNSLLYTIISRWRSQNRNQNFQIHICHKSNSVSIILHLSSDLSRCHLKKKTMVAAPPSMIH